MLAANVLVATTPACTYPGVKVTTVLTVVATAAPAFITGRGHNGLFCPPLLQLRRSLMTAVLAPVTVRSRAVTRPLAAVVLLCAVTSPRVQETGGQRPHLKCTELADPGVVVAEMGAPATGTTDGTSTTVGGATTDRAVTPTGSLRATTTLVIVTSQARGGFDQIPLPVTGGVLSEQIRLNTENTQG